MTEPVHAATRGEIPQRGWTNPMNEPTLSRMAKPMPTPEDRRRFADSTKDLPAWAQLTPEEIELWDEADHAQPVNHGSSAEGIAAMTRRLELLRGFKAKVLAQLERADLTADVRTALKTDLAQLTQQTTQATERQAAYALQLKQSN